MNCKDISKRQHSQQTDPKTAQFSDQYTEERDGQIRGGHVSSKPIGSARHHDPKIELCSTQ